MVKKKRYRYHPLTAMTYPLEEKEFQKKYDEKVEKERKRLFLIKIKPR